MSVYCILFCFVFSLYSGGVGYWSTAGTTVYVFFVYSELCWENQKKVENTSENRFGMVGRGSWDRGTCGHQTPAALEGRAQTPVISEAPPMLPLGSTIPSKGGFIFFYACGANVLTLETGTCHFMPAASPRALAAVNEQQASDHLNGISRVSNVSCQRSILHVSLRHQSAQTEKRSRAEVPCVSKLGTKTFIKKVP